MALREKAKNRPIAMSRPAKPGTRFKDSKKERTSPAKRN